MGRPKQAPPAAVEAVRERIEEWRTTRAKRTQMPDALWAGAVGVARRHGVWAVSRALRVNYECLKRRCGESKALGEPDGAAGSGGFVELRSAAVFGTAEPAGAVIELADADGAKLTVRLGAGTTLDLSALATAFLERRR